MSEAAFAVVALLVLTWAVTSDLLARVNINGPMVFSVAGYVLANPDWECCRSTSRRRPST